MDAWLQRGQSRSGTDIPNMQGKEADEVCSLLANSRSVELESIGSKSPQLDLGQWFPGNEFSAKIIGEHIFSKYHCFQ
ncbi:MAG: hypothetical protein KA312_01570 [Sphingorhabdus sp.]|nr:hypothetical protein [Sphingorhabdus sp.]